MLMAYQMGIRKEPRKQYLKGSLSKSGSIFHQLKTLFIG